MPIVSGVLLYSCGGNASTQSECVADTTAIAETVIELPEYVPDTVFPSAAQVTWCIDTLMPEVDGRIDSLTDDYTGASGIMTFRGNLMRNADYNGHISYTPGDITVDWVYTTDEDYTLTSHGRWGGGTGWTGQPLYIDWDMDGLARLRQANLVDSEFSGKEIIVGSLSRKIYFIDFISGRASRDAVPVGNPIKGTVSFDPSFNGNLYFGHGVPAESPFGANLLDLYTDSITFTFGRDPKAWRGWGAYDSSPVRVGQFLIWPGENGSLYKWIVCPGSLKLYSVMRYRVNEFAPGMESSIAVWRNLGYVADNHGNIICVNLNTFEPRWHYSLHDDIDATPVLSEESGVPYLYVGCEVDRQGEGEARFVKLNALTGEEIWLNTLEACRVQVDEKHFDGGYYATALLGSGDCAHLVMLNCVLNTNEKRNGVFVAFNRKDGSEAYKVKLDSYAWSSPVSMQSDDGHTYIITADCIGNIYVIRGIDGEIMVKRKIGMNFESSPIVIGNNLIIGSRGNSIYKLTVK